MGMAFLAPHFPPNISAGEIGLYLSLLRIGKFWLVLSGYNHRHITRNTGRNNKFMFANS